MDSLIKMIQEDKQMAYGKSIELFLANGTADSLITVSYTHLDVYKRQGVDKAQGILEAGRKLGLKREEIAVVGDDRNDLTCFKTFENSFCMASAEPEVRDEARWTVESVAEALAIVQRENKQRS